MQREVHDEPAAVSRVARPRRRTLLSAERTGVGVRSGVAGVSERSPGTQHPIGQQPLRRSHAEVRHRRRVEHEGQLRAVTCVTVTERQTRPHARIARHVIEHVHPHRAARRHAGASRPPRRTQKDVVSHNLKAAQSLTQAVGDAHDQRLREVADVTAVVERFGGGARDEIPAVDPQHHRKRRHQRSRQIHAQRNEDVQPQNQSLPVYLCPAHLLGTLVSDGSDAGLHACRSGIGGVVHPSPGCDGTGRFPARRCHRRISERDPIKHIALVQRQALNEPIFSQQLGSGSSSLWASERLISDQCCWRDAAQESCQLHLII